MSLHIMPALIAIMSLALFAAMGIDKRRSRTGARRIPAKALFLLALLGGAPGGTAGMFLFRHKTRHWYFRFGFPLLAAAQLLLLFFFTK